MVEISTSTTSLFFKNRRGFLNAPTPAGVPVMTAVPAGMVVPVICVTDQQKWATVTAGPPAILFSLTNKKGTAHFLTHLGSSDSTLWQESK
jgi:hypothetical protein